MTTDTALDNKVKRVVSNIRNLPTPPVVFHQIQKVINDPSVNATQVASILAEDPAMSVKVLKMTNSAFYGLAREIESVRQAVVIIGFEAIKNLVLSASVLDMFKGKNMDQEYQEKFWRHSLSTAVCCRLLARKLRDRAVVDADAAFSAGLLHDVGKMVISYYLPDEHALFIAERQKDKQSKDHEIEERLFGYHHAQIGGFLAAQWKIPRRLTDAIEFHHHPAMDLGEESIASLVHLANFIAKRTYYDRSEQHLIGGLDPWVTQTMGIQTSDIDAFAESLKDEYNKAETFMQMVGL